MPLHFPQLGAPNSTIGRPPNCGNPTIGGAQLCTIGRGAQLCTIGRPPNCGIPCTALYCTALHCRWVPGHAGTKLWDGCGHKAVEEWIIVSVGAYLNFLCTCRVGMWLTAQSQVGLTHIYFND
jgi:hypothetical protein